jgi:hypothetical protein
LAVAVLSVSLYGCGSGADNEAKNAASTACDRLAADPDDPHKTSDGVAIDDLDLEAAIEACIAAVEADSENARLRFQLGRVLAAADHTDEALPFLEDAAADDYPAALAYIGHLQDTDNEARPYYERAAQENYAPAIEALEEMETSKDRESNATSSAERPLASISAEPNESPNGFRFSRLVGRVYRGELNGVPDDNLTRSLLLSMWPVFNAHCGERNPFLALNMMAYGGFIVGLNSLGTMAADPARSDFPSIREGLRTQRPTLFQEPGEDAVLLVTDYGCGSPEFRQFLGNFDRIIATRSSKSPDPFDALAFHELMSDSFRQSLGLPDPAQVRQERQAAKYALEATASCVQQYQQGPFCRCMIQNLQSMKLEDAEWRALAADFSGLSKLAGKYEGLRPALRSCNS